jgi:hypothetical protein
MHIRAIYWSILFGSFVLAASTLAVAMLLDIKGVSDQFLGEDKLIENLSALSFFCVSIMSLVLIYRGTRQKILCGVLAILGISGFLDEVGFGTRLIDSKIHKVYGVPLDGLHDLFTIVIRWLSKYASTPEILAFIIAVVLIVYMSARWGRKHISRLVQLIKSGPEFWFLFIAIVFAVIASVIDLDFFDHRSIEGQVFQFLEEMLELYVGLALLFSCISVYLKDSVDRRSLGKN